MTESFATLLERLRDEADRAYAAYQAASLAYDVARKRAAFEKHDIYVGDRVTSRGKVYEVCDIEVVGSLGSPPWLLGHPIKKDGTVGKGFHRLFHWSKCLP